ncbi:putative esterase family protein [Mycobacterium lentiflavum]|uniref:Putative esterase family protein n=1 Tax=Mycobacterium lentiflavum TaxID=141349 RepID=A0A0E4GUY2_MYCLN|nr:alpha/beta hydrolase-fold protein [Mycobacterium lentiflavum]CQD03239.1 putative esterase family protein [Mycobacterium lentiflavum]
MPQFLGNLSLLHGWLPLATQALALLVALIVIDWRRPSWLRRALPVALVVAAAVAALAYWYIVSLGVAGDPAPKSLWLWIALSGLTAAVLVLGWKGARWWRRGLAFVSVPLCVLCAGMSLNLWVGYFPTVLAAWNQLTSEPLPDQIDRLQVTAMQVAGTKPDKGVVVPVNIDSNASHFPHRQELVYLPPAWFNTNPPPRLPTVMMLGSAFNLPRDWLGPGGAFTAIDGFAARHHGFAPVFVFPDPTGAFDNDTECVNGSRGNAADHLTKDVVPFMVSNFGVSADRANWGVAGWSMGGTCAVTLAVMHPELFSAFVDIAGDFRPNIGSKEQTIAELFGGDTAAWADYDPLTVMTRHGRYTGLSGWFDIPAPPGAHSVPQAANPALVSTAAANPEGQDAAAHALCTIAEANGITCAVVTQLGKHDWPFAAEAFDASLPWLASTLGTPNVEPVPLPQRGSGQPN